MFKNLISSMNGNPVRGPNEKLANGDPSKPTPTNQKLPNQPDNQKTSNGYQRVEDGQLEVIGVSKTYRTLSKRSKKKFSAMMGKLQSIGKKDTKQTDGSSTNDNNNNNTNHDDDDDDEYHISATSVHEKEPKEAENGSTQPLNDNHISSSYCSERLQDDDADSSSSREFLSAEFDLDLNSDVVAKGDTEAGVGDPKSSQRALGGGQYSAGSGYELDDKANYVLPEEQCDIPTFLHTKNCDPYLIEETRRLLKDRYAKNPDSFYDHDVKRMLTDDWTVSRFLLRRRLDPKRTAKLMEECGRFRKQYKMSEVELWEFPIEFHKAGGLFKYAPDRVGNLTVYMRVKMYRRVPEISDVFKAFILCVLEQADRANGGRGTAVIFDLSGCGLQNVDLGFLSWLLSSFRNYCPKGVSYILVYNLPWILNATCKLAMTWMSASNRRALRFVYGDEIENFIDRENLPDYLGGSCKINYRAVPEGSKPAIEVCDQLDMTTEQALKIRELFKEYLDEDDFTDDEKGRAGKSKKNKKQLANGSAGAH